MRMLVRAGGPTGTGFSTGIRYQCWWLRTSKFGRESSELRQRRQRLLLLFFLRRLRPWFIARNKVVQE
jgi:hypothetical protein